MNAIYEQLLQTGNVDHKVDHNRIGYHADYVAYFKISKSALTARKGLTV
jgi:secreted PhoX family phosphatase